MLYKGEYSHDELGRVVFNTETVLASPRGAEYRYDQTGRLAEIYEGDGDCGQVSCPLAASYAYDANGNRTSVTLAGGTTTASYDAQDRLLSYGASLYTYTAAGELSKKVGPDGTTTYGYDVLGNLRSVGLPNGSSVEYITDGLGRRVGKKVNAALKKAWLYGGAVGPIAELGPNGATVVSRFVYAAKPHVPAYMVKNYTVYRILSDQLGSVRLVVDLLGNVAQRLDYDAWGKVLLDTNPGFQPFGFAGGLYDPDTSLVRFGARDYDPAVGRWTAKDPVLFRAGTTNLYGYVLGDPVNWRDPLGLIPWGPAGDFNTDLGGGAFLTPPPVTAVRLTSGAGFDTDAELSLSHVLWSLGFGRQPDDAFVIFAHGLRSGSLNLADIVGGNVHDVADWVRSQPGYAPGMPVQLNACWAGVEGGMAQALSEELGVPVSGPVDMIDQFGEAPEGGPAPWNVYLEGQVIGH